MDFNIAEYALVYQALREAASATRVEVRRVAYLALAKKMKEERDARSRSVDVVAGSSPAGDVVRETGSRVRPGER
jgi:hypothetical protein